jgi:hypothetical protein
MAAKDCQVPTMDWRRLQSAKLKGKPKSEQTKLRMRQPKSTAHRKHISTALLNSTKLKGRTAWNKGKHLPQFSTASKKGWLNRKRGEKRSENSCQNMSVAMKNSWAARKQRGQS